MIGYITFNNGSFKDCFSKAISENVINCHCGFILVTLVESLIIGILPILQFKVKIQYNSKFCTFLFVSWSSRFILKMKSFVRDFYLEKILFKNNSKGSI